MDLSRINNPNRLLTRHPFNPDLHKFNIFSDMLSNNSLFYISKWIIEEPKFSNAPHEGEGSWSLKFQRKSFIVGGSRIYFCFPNQKASKRSWADWQSYLQDPSTELDPPLPSVKCKQQSEFKRHSEEKIRKNIDWEKIQKTLTQKIWNIAKNCPSALNGCVPLALWEKVFFLANQLRALQDWRFLFSCPRSSKEK